MNNPLETPEKLYTCIMKCAHCLKELGRQLHMTRNQRISPIRAGYKPCVLHPDYGFVTELVPEE